MRVITSGRGSGGLYKGFAVENKSTIYPIPNSPSSGELFYFHGCVIVVRGPPRSGRLPFRNLLASLS